MYLAPPTVPGLTFNAMVNYQTSEIGTFSMINNHDIGQHYAGNTAVSSQWHALKDASANTFLVHKESFGAMYAKLNQLVLSQAGSAAALPANASAADKATDAANVANALRGVKEIAFALTCTANSDCGGITGDTKAITSTDLLAVFPFEMSAHATKYGELSDVCHLLTALGGPNTCLTAGAGGTATSTLVYAPNPVSISTPAGAVEIAGIGDLSSLNFPVNSSAKCIASLIDPPFPQEIIFPPFFMHSIIIFADS